MKADRKLAFYNDLKERVLTLDLAPGSALDEVALSQQYGVSRTPLREVFQRLAGEGYLTLEKNRGAAVSSMDLDVMRNFFQTAPMIYAAIARLAAENATPRQVEELKAAQKRFREAVAEDRPADMVMLNHRFHEVMGEMAGSPYLTPSLNRLLIDHTRMSQTFYRPKSGRERARVESACDQHDGMIEAIETSTPARAVELTLEHWELSRNQIELYVRPDPLPVDPEAHYGGGARDAV